MHARIAHLAILYSVADSVHNLHFAQICNLAVLLYGDCNRVGVPIRCLLRPRLQLNRPVR